MDSPAFMLGHVVHVDLIPFTEICLGGIQYYMLICDKSSTYLYSIPMKTKRNFCIIIAFTTMIAYFKQHRFKIHTLHSYYESSLMSVTTFINQQGIRYNTIVPYQHEQKLERYSTDHQLKISVSIVKLKIQTPK